MQLFNLCVVSAPPNSREEERVKVCEGSKGGTWHFRKRVQIAPVNHHATEPDKACGGQEARPGQGGSQIVARHFILLR
jgi:hypothetical protein